jgi:hypothetical protein
MSLAPDVVEQIRKMRGRCVCGRREFMWHSFEYSHDMFAFITGQPIYCHFWDGSGCGDEEE